MAPRQMPPRIRGWYRAADGSLFEVVAVDERDGSVELQYQDGTLEELDLEAWEELEVAPAEPAVVGLDPEDEDLPPWS